MSVATAKSSHEKADQLQDALAKVSETEIPVMSRDRHIPRTEQAKLTRELFKRLGLKGISVTTPNYSMAQSVRVSLPKLEIHCPNYWPHGGDYCHHGYVDESLVCPTCRENRRIREKIEEILARAFPNHDDRSDTQKDYFDYCWSVN